MKDSKRKNIPLLEDFWQSGQLDADDMYNWLTGKISISENHFKFVGAIFDIHWNKYVEEDQLIFRNEMAKEVQEAFNDAYLDYNKDLIPTKEWIDKVVDLFFEYLMSVNLCYYEFSKS